TASTSTLFPYTTLFRSITAIRNMEILLLILGFVALTAGLAGAFLPIPGPPLSFIGLLLLQWSGFAQFSISVLGTLGFITLVISRSEEHTSELQSRENLV